MLWELIVIRRICLLLWFEEAFPKYIIVWMQYCAFSCQAGGVVVMQLNLVVRV